MLMHSTIWRSGSLRSIPGLRSNWSGQPINWFSPSAKVVRIDGPHDEPHRAHRSRPQAQREFIAHAIALRRIFALHRSRRGSPVEWSIGSPAVLTDGLDELVALGVEQLGAKATDIERFVADLSVGILPDPEAIARARRDAEDMVTGLEAMRTVLERQAQEQES